MLDFFADFEEASLAALRVSTRSSMNFGEEIKETPVGEIWDIAHEKSDWGKGMRLGDGFNTIISSDSSHSLSGAELRTSKEK